MKKAEMNSEQTATSQSYAQSDVLLASPRTPSERNLWTMQSALERISHSAHGDANWMRGVARKALAALVDDDQ